MNFLHVFRNGYDLDNYSQCREAAGLFFLVAHRAYDGSIAAAFMAAERPSGWVPEIDGRTAEMRAYRQAEKTLNEALSAYDQARRAVTSRVKKA